VLWHEESLLNNDRKVTSYATAVARQWLISGYVGTPKGTNATIELQQRKTASCAFRAAMFVTSRRVCEESFNKTVVDQDNSWVQLL
jgi:hypothetical protein